MPAVLILEAMAQVGGLLLLNSVDDPTDKLMYFIGIDGAKFRRPVTPGDQLRLKLTLLKLRGRTSKMRGEAFVDARLGAHALLTGWTRIGSGCRIHHGAVLGSPPQDLKFKGERTQLVIGADT